MSQLGNGEVRDSLYAKCFAFVSEQSRGEWGEALVGDDAHKLEAFVLAVLAERDGWRPIDLESKSVGRVLLHIPAYVAGEPVRLGAWDTMARVWRTTSGICHRDAQPTHWRPLPAPPSPSPLQAREKGE